MAQAANNRSSLKEAILRVWTPAVGVQSIQELWVQNFLGIMGVTDEYHPLIFDFVNVIVRNYVEELYKKGFQTDLAKYFDNQGPFQLKNALVSGSWSEGLFVYAGSSTEFTPPDVDFMCVLKNIKFNTTDQVCGNLVVREDTPFVNAYIADEVDGMFWKDFLHDTFDHHSSNKHQLSSVKLKNKLGQNYFNVGNLFRPSSHNVQYKVHSEPDSAAFTVDNEKPKNTENLDSDSMRFCVDALYDETKWQDEFGYVIRENIEKVFYKLLPSTDIVLALSCDGWPLCAGEWITRERMWPNKDLIEKITQNGFHIVPKCSPQGDFRLSFSSAETSLIKHLSPFQHKIVISFKGVVKYHQCSWSPHIKDIITTYHLKTIAFWYFEKTSEDSFSEDTVDTHLILLLRELAAALMKGELPMYFMPKVNLLVGVHNDEAIDTFEKIIILTTNYATITQTVEKLSKLDVDTVIKDVMKEFCMLWENAKKYKNTDVENQIPKNLSVQLSSIKDDENQSATSNTDLEKMQMNEFLTFLRSMIDLMTYQFSNKE